MNPLEQPHPRHFDPAEMALRGRIGAYRLHATHDARETTKKAREAFLAKFIREVDPDRVLSEDERLRRAKAARSAYYAQLALRSRQARTAKRNKRESQEKAAGYQPAAVEEVRGDDASASTEF